MIGIYIAVEDQLSEAIAKRLITEISDRLSISVSMGRKGNTYLRNKLPALIKLAPNIPVLLLTDLDNIECAPTLINNWTGNTQLPQNFLFRVAVREIESWLLADKAGFARFSGIPENRLTINPETLPDPKQELLNLVRRHGRKNVKDELLPTKGSNAKVGFGYNSALCGFVEENWNFQEAARRADSLARTVSHIQRFAAAYP